MYFREVIGWIRRWRSVPVFAWTRAAAHFSQGQFEAAAREYEGGLHRYPRHRVAPYARLDLSVCCERLGAYDQACDHLTRLASEKGPLQQVARIHLCHALLLSDRGGEASRIAALLRLDSQSSSSTAELLSVKALALLENDIARVHVPSTPRARILSRPAREAHRRGSLSRTSPVVLGRMRSSVASRPQSTRAPDVTPLAIEGKLAIRLQELRPYRSAHDLVNAVLQLADGPGGADKAIELAEAKHANGLWLWILAGQKLIERKEPLRARRLLNRALAVEPRAPKILTLLARTYLISGEGYSPSFAVQLATKACQHAGWLSPQAHAVLAECFYHSGDKLAALTVVQGSRSRLADPQIQLLLESLTEQLVS